MIYEFQREAFNFWLLKNTISNTAAIGHTPVSMTSHEGSLSIEFSDSLNQNQQDALTAIVAAHSDGSGIARAEIYKVTTSPNKPTKVAWYSTDEGNGVYSGLAREDIYAYSSGKLSSITTKKYYTDGVQYAQSKIDYKTIDANNTVEKPA